MLLLYIRSEFLAQRAGLIAMTRSKKGVSQMMFSKEIQIKTNLLIILMVCMLLIILVVLCLTNVIPNLFFATITAGQIDSVTIYEQSGERNATLSETDVKALCELLQDVRLKGRSVRLFIAESFNPQYTIQLKSGIAFDIACYSDYYIINGRGYIAEGSHHNNFIEIGEQYLEHLGSREYFPRETNREDQQ